MGFRAPRSRRSRGEVRSKLFALASGAQCSREKGLIVTSIGNVPSARRRASRERQFETMKPPRMCATASISFPGLTRSSHRFGDYYGKQSPAPISGASSRTLASVARSFDVVRPGRVRAMRDHPQTRAGRADRVARGAASRRLSRKARMSGSIVDRIDIPTVLRIAGRAVPNERGWFRCPRHPDANPSAHVVPSSNGRAWCCFGCDARGGILDLAVAIGIAADRAGAARTLESRVG